MAINVTATTKVQSVTRVAIVDLLPLLDDTRRAYGDLLGYRYHQRKQDRAEWQADASRGPSSRSAIITLLLSRKRSMHSDRVIGTTEDTST